MSVAVHEPDAMGVWSEEDGVVWLPRSLYPRRTDAIRASADTGRSRLVAHGHKFNLYRCAGLFGDLDVLPLRSVGENAVSERPVTPHFELKAKAD